MGMFLVKNVKAAPARNFQTYCARDAKKRSSGRCMLAFAISSRKNRERSNLSITQHHGRDCPRFGNSLTICETLWIPDIDVSTQTHNETLARETWVTKD